MLFGSHFFLSRRSAIVPNRTILSMADGKSLTVGHVFGIVVALYFLDKWLDRKVKHFIDYARSTPSHRQSVEQFLPFEETKRTFAGAGQYLSDIPNRLQYDVSNMTAPHGDALFPLTSGSLSATQMYGEIPPSPSGGPAATTNMQNVASISDPKSLPNVLMRDGNYWRPSGSTPIPIDAMPSDSLVGLSPDYEQIAQKDGSQAFDAMMMSLDEHEPLSNDIQMVAKTYHH